MIRLKRIAVLLALSACAGVVPAQQPQAVVQDGIAVKPLPSFRHMVGAEQLDQQSAQQYAATLSEARQKGALVPDRHPEVIRLRQIAKRIIPHSARWNADAATWKWQVNLISSPEVNAFCMPGGRIAFYTGIITKLKLTDDEVAAIMGHEIAHALREHARERMVKASGTNMVARLAGAGIAAWLGIDPQIADTVAAGTSHLIGLTFSRSDEREADLVGLDLAARAGFDPRAGVAVWRKMGALDQRTPIKLLSTHPGGADRIRIIEDHMHLLLPLYARNRGTTVNRLAPYRSTSLN